MSDQHHTAVEEETARTEAEAAAPAEAAPAEPVAAEGSAPVEPEAAPEPQPDPAPEAEAPPAEDDAPAVGPKILGVAPETKPLPIVKKKLREKPPPPKREPLPWPELREVVGMVRQDADTAQLKELFRILPPKVRDEVVENVRGFQKGARRPLSQHAAKQLARSVHTARRMKRNAAPSAEVSDALAQAIVGELIASLDVEVAAEVILPKRDLLEREARQARRRARDEEEKRREEQRRKRREDAKGARGQSSFGTFSGTKIKGLDEVAAAFGVAQADPEPESEPEPQDEAPAEETPTPEPPAEETPAPEAPADAEEARPTEPAPEDEAPASDDDA